MKDDQKHTPTPWVKQANADSYTHIIRTEDGKFIVQFSQTDEGRANAEFAVRACNAHDKLGEALSNLLDCVDGNYREVADECRAALAFARGEVLQP